MVRALPVRWTQCFSVGMGRMLYRIRFP
jgi:hypothetical protein